MRKSKVNLSTTPKVMIPPLSDKEKAVLLRQGRSVELQAGGVWYMKNDTGGFDRVETNEQNINKAGYREFVIDCSKKGLIFLNREKPNYSLSKAAHGEDKHNIEKYAKQRNNKKSR